MNELDNNYKQLFVLNTVYNNLLCNTTHNLQLSIIKTPLLLNQSILVHGMHKYVQKMLYGFMYETKIISGNIGILGDENGSGKTLSILAYLASIVSNNIVQSNTTKLDKASTEFFTTYNIVPINNNRIHLIIVPPHLYQHWINQIKTHTTIKYVAIETKRYLNMKNLSGRLQTANFILTTSKCYKFVEEYAIQNNLEWDNVVIDDATHIYVRDIQIKFKFMWLISSNWKSLLFHGSTISKRDLCTFTENIQINSLCKEWLLENNSEVYSTDIILSVFIKKYIPYENLLKGLLVIKCHPDIIRKSYEILEINEEKIKCKSYTTIQSLAYYFQSRQIQPNINSDNAIDISNALSISTYEKDIYICCQPRIKQALVSEKLKEPECTICLEKAEHCTVVNCCYNIYCAKCLLYQIITNRTCPTCRELLYSYNLGIITDIDDNFKNKNVPQTKVDTCMHIIKTHINHKFIIYTAFENTYYQVYSYFNNMGIKIDRIDNTISSLNKVLGLLNDNKIQAVFVSNIDVLRGISMQSIDHLIFFHEIHVYEERETLLAYFQGIGRKKPLHVVDLTSVLPI